MTENERTHRRTLYFQVMDAADDEFFIWAAHHFYNDAKLRFLQMPWDDKHPASDYLNSKTKQKSDAAKSKAAVDGVVAQIGQDLLGVASKIEFEHACDPVVNDWKATVHNAGANKEGLSDINTIQGALKPFGSDWCPILSAPVLNKKAYNPVGRHLKTGSLIKYKYSIVSPFPTMVGTVKSRTKYFVKVQNGKHIDTVPYSNIHYVAVTT